MISHHSHPPGHDEIMNRHQQIAIPIVSSLVIFGIGCGRSDSGSGESLVQMKSDVADLLIDEDSRIQDFGPVLSRPGRKLNHNYQLINKTKHKYS